MKKMTDLETLLKHREVCPINYTGIWIETYVKQHSTKNVTDCKSKLCPHQKQLIFQNFDIILWVKSMTRKRVKVNISLIKFQWVCDITRKLSISNRWMNLTL